MITEGLLSFFFELFLGVLNTFDILSLPGNFISYLANVLVYGTWTIGADLLAMVITTVVWWFGFKFAIGLILFIWRLLPLT